ncbi:Hypothetical predicted protein [Mytilus galloprovincialis]|uniref:THAP-type domain-containing protein n=1 Tax=Mytilus galloprovincialis TaxID=29158 RepID=A0A8B6FBC9_MYTGA|nr:Hypothetical predicted protein [Mytilus galloprovincialis]
MDKQQEKKVTKWYHCAAEGCTSDDRKRAKYPYMQNNRFHSFPTEKKNPKLRETWLKLLRRDDAYVVPTFKQRVFPSFRGRISESSEYKNKACQTKLTSDDIDRLTSLENNRGVLLREAVEDIVTKNYESVKKYTGVPSKSQLIGILEVLDEAEPKVKNWSGKQSTNDVNNQSVDSC